jgi:hypothetical protein
MSLSRRLRGWVQIAAIVAFAAAVAWEIGREASRAPNGGGIVPLVAHHPPLPGVPSENQTVADYKTIARMGWVPNLDGTVIAYVIEGDCLLQDGRFRTDLSLEEMAEALSIEAASIANPRSPNEIDPDAELFRAQSGVLTDKSKESARAHRRQLLAGDTPDGLVEEWIVTEFLFTLNRLKHPSNEEKVVLAAIARAAVGTKPVPGDKVRAVGVSKGLLDAGRIALSLWMLPPALPTIDPGRAVELR